MVRVGRRRGIITPTAASSLLAAVKGERRKKTESQRTRGLRLMHTRLDPAINFYMMVVYNVHIHMCMY